MIVAVSNTSSAFAPIWNRYLPSAPFSKRALVAKPFLAIRTISPSVRIMSLARATASARLMPAAIVNSSPKVFFAFTSDLIEVNDVILRLSLVSRPSPITAARSTSRIIRVGNSFRTYFINAPVDLFSRIVCLSNTKYL